MTTDPAAEFRARVQAAAGIHLAHAAWLADSTAISDTLARLIQQLEDEAGADKKQIAALVTQYKAGKLTLTDLVAQAHQIVQDSSDDAIDDAGDGKRAKHSMLSLSAMLGVMGGLSVIGHSAGEQTRSQGDGALKALQRTAVQQGAAAGAAEQGGKVDSKAVKKALGDVDDRVRAVIDSLNGGDISGPQAANQIQTIIGGANWLEYQKASVGAIGADEWNWVLDPDAAHCSDPDGQDCPSFAEGGPYKTEDLPAYPADGTTPCSGNCRCELEPVEK